MAAAPSAPCPAPLTPRDRWCALLVVVATIAAYLPALAGELIWNDRDYVTAPALQSVDGLWRIWAEAGATQQYYPLLHTAFWVQHRLWGDLPLGYHLVTLLAHVGAALLFALFLRRLALPGAWGAAVLFALHPVHVQSVAWITEQKNTLSLVGYLAAAVLYLDFEATRRTRPYLLALGCFGLSLLCKTVTATLPAALLVVQWWRHGRLEWRRDVRPLLPWQLLAVAAALFSSWVERRYVGAEGPDLDLPLLGRCLVAGRAAWTYLAHLVWPAGLNFVYPRWPADPAAAAAGAWLYPLALVAVLGGLWRWRRRSRTPLAVALLFVGSLFPVLGFVNLYGAVYSWVWDHWQYLADLAPLALAGAGLTLALARIRPGLRAPDLWLAGLLAVGLGTLTWRHCGMFRNDETLYRTILARNPAAWMAHENLGRILAERPGQLPAAIAEYQEALRLCPTNANILNNLGIAYARTPGRTPDAVAQFEAALRLVPNHAFAHGNLGKILAGMPGRQAEALAHLQAAVRGKPDQPETYNNLGNLLLSLPGRLPEAIAAYESALRYQPNLADAHNGLGAALARFPARLPEAVAHLERAVQLNPGFAEAHCNLGNILRQVPGCLPEAIAHFEAAIRADPRMMEAHWGLAQGLARTPGREKEAAAAFARVLEINPGFAPARAGLEQLRAASAAGRPPAP